jgi:hypothetical protein
MLNDEKHEVRMGIGNGAMIATCTHTFAYWSVIPPSHCPVCARPVPASALVMPSPWP